MLTHQENPNRNYPPRKLDYIEEYILTLVKIKNGYEENCLASLFHISESLVGRIFNAWTKFLGRVVESMIIWPTQEMSAANLPPQFKEDFQNTISIIDCYELQSERSSRPGAQRITFCHYKRRNTFDMYKFSSLPRDEFFSRFT